MPYKDNIKDFQERASEQCLGGRESYEKEMEVINFRKEEKKSKPFKQNSGSEVDEKLGNQYDTEDLLF